MKRIWWIVGGVAVFVLLVAAAFVGGRLLNKPQQQAGKGQMVIKGAGGGNQQFSVQLDPAKELPSPKADVVGIYKSRSEGGILVGTGQVRVMMTKASDGSVATSTQNDGPAVEVVITHGTTIYRDATLKQSGTPPQNGKLQQVLELGVADEIGENSMIQAWGERSGDRLVATVLVYSMPAFVKLPGGG